MTGYLHDPSSQLRHKLKLAWLSFALLGLPTALAMSAGVPEQIALMVMTVLTIPCVYTLDRWLNRRGLRQILSTATEQDSSDTIDQTEIIDSKNSVQAANCLLICERDEESLRIANHLQLLLRSFSINLLIDLFSAGAAPVQIQTLGIEAVLFLSSDENLSSAPLQLQLTSVGQQGVPILTVRRSGIAPSHLRNQFYWDLPSTDSAAFRNGVQDLAVAIQRRILLRRYIRRLRTGYLVEEASEAAAAIATEFEPALLSEFATELAGRYSDISDLAIRSLIKQALRKTNSPEARALIDGQSSRNRSQILEGKHLKKVNVLLVAAVSSILHGVLAGIFLPLLAMLLLSFGALPGPLAAVASAEHGMIFAVAAPFAYAAIGFAGGALLAFLYNAFVEMLLKRNRTKVKASLEVENAGEHLLRVS